MIKKIASLSVLSSPFRLLFFLTALSGFLMPALWVSFYTGKTTYPDIFFAPMHWHGFEMLFGFALALIAGFLLTASSNWAKKPQIAGWPVLGMGLVWLAERVIVLLPGVSAVWLYTSSVLFYMIFLYCLGKNLISTKKNALIFLPLMLVFFVARILFIYGEDSATIELMNLGRDMGVDVIRMIIVVITGRIVPFFMRSRLQVNSIKVPGWIELASIYTLLLAIGISYFEIHPVITSTIWLLCAVLHILRFAYFRPDLALAHPMLWILHLAYVFLIAHFILEGLEYYYGALAIIKLHTFTAGALGLVSVGMMTRVSLGHTGRAIVSNKLIIAIFGCIFVGALLRILFPIFFLEYYMRSLHYSSGFWTLGFGLFLAQFTKILFQKRPDAM